jgi:hypothetical protein
MVWWGFVIGLRFRGCFHSFYECWVSHNIKIDICLIKQSCPFLGKIFFFGWIQSLEQWNLLKGSNVVISLLEPYMLFVGGVKIWAPSTWDVKSNSPSTKGFDDSMVTSFVHPSKIWVGTSMSFSGGGTSPPYWANMAFPRGCAFEHIGTPAHPLPSYW